MSKEEVEVDVSMLDGFDIRVLARVTCGSTTLQKSRLPFSPASILPPFAFWLFI